jgi:malate dehydrogenase (oxaloacetate-decarboxylating)(NADP+)
MMSLWLMRAKICNIPVPFDPRLISTVAPAVARAAVESGVSRISIDNWQTYERDLGAALNPSLDIFSILYDSLRNKKRRVIFAEGEEEKIIKVAAYLRDGGYVAPILVGDAKKIEATMDAIGLSNREGITVANAALSDKNDVYIEHMYNKTQRFGMLRRDVVREVKNDRNVFASCMLDCGDGDALVTGLTRRYTDSLKAVRSLIRSKGVLFGFSIVISGGRTVFIADTSVHCELDATTMADIAISLSAKVARMGHKPRVAFLSYANFGNAKHNRGRIRGAMEILESRKVTFEYDGEMTAEVALNRSAMSAYPFAKLTDAANILIMPNLDAANISYKLIRELGGSTVFGPVLVGAEKSVQITTMNASVTDIQNLAVWAAADVGSE